MSHRLATTCLSLLLFLTAALMVRGHHVMPLPPHSSHDGFLCSFRSWSISEGQTPVDGRFGMFQPTWFSSRVEATHVLGWSGFAERVLGNVESHLIDTPTRWR